MQGGVIITNPKKVELLDDIAKIYDETRSLSSNVTQEFYEKSVKKLDEKRKNIGFSEEKIDRQLNIVIAQFRKKYENKSK